MLDKLKEDLAKAIAFLSNEKHEEFDTELNPDNVKYEGDAIEVGTVVSIKGEDGEFTLAPAGEYQLGDVSFTVEGEEGKVSKVSQPDEPDTDEPADTPSLEDRVQALESAIDGVKQVVADLISIVEHKADKTEVQEFSDVSDKLTIALEKLAGVPASKSITTQAKKTDRFADAKRLDFIKAVNANRTK